MKWTL